MNVNVTSPPKPLPPVADTHSKRITWWVGLAPQWRAAFGSAFFGHAQLPTPDELENLWRASALRFAGRTASAPNVPFELTDCSGLAGMSNVEILVLSYHRIDAISEVASLPQLKSLFVYNNGLRSLAGVEGLKKLEQLYAQVNRIESLEPLRNLTNLKEIYVNFNALESLDGITPKHARALKSFFCLPNDCLPDRQVMRFERNVGIRCRTV